MRGLKGSLDTEPQRNTAHSPAMRTVLPSLAALANGRYSVTVRYEGINKADPMRNMVRCENLPLGGLQGVSEQLCSRLWIGAHPTFLWRSQFKFHWSAKARDSRVEVKLVCDLEQTHESNYPLSQILRSESSTETNLIDRSDLGLG